MDRRHFFLSFLAVYLTACAYYREALALLPAALLPIAAHELSHILALYLLLPISAYFFGAFLSEFLGKSVRRLRLLRWDTLLIGIEAAVVLALGFLPEQAPDQICQIALNFICSMQFNTFRQVKGIPAATTFVTNHIRQVGANAAKFLRHRDKESGKRLALHGTMCIKLAGYRAIWGAAALLLVVFLRLCYADRVLEKDKWEQVPHGH